MDDLEPEIRDVVHAAVDRAKQLADGQFDQGRAVLFAEASFAGIVVMAQNGQRDVERLALYGFSRGMLAIGSGSKD